MSGQRIEFTIEGRLTPTADSAIVLADEDPLTELLSAAVQTISTDVMLTCGGVTMHLAAWQDPEHWSDDWQEHADGQNADEYVNGLVADAMATTRRTS